MSGAVFDASALLAMAFAEPGADKAIAYLSIGRVSAVNYSEAGTKLIDKGMNPEEAFALLGALGLEVVAFDVTEAKTAAGLRQQRRRLGLSFADRACLALADRNAAVVLTTDRAWASLEGLACTVSLLR
ncbi:type II toxin-antitoxin system VapC family toxin [Pararhizobium gei]|uniref:type II toxin-antitoxin system VapC family toxin n=1 Tax=Pararhizobium gei TaxID=1395951 RepID=UPI0023DC733B|nr:type II toxin-antitoxin system VapC family toxin [Rhizobium gei]